MQPQLAEYADLHRRSRDEAFQVAEGLDDAQFNWKPSGESWSVAECLQHLNVVAEAYLPVLEKAVADSRHRANGPFEYGFVARKMIEGVRPGGPALKTGVKLNPSDGGARSSLSRGSVLGAFEEHVARYVAACERADGLDLARTKLRYPFMRLLRLPLGAVLQITGLHALRHTEQAEHVTQRESFPR
jgi:hypothetical protein